MNLGYRNHTLWAAFLLHRISGVALALFLPLHFWVLSYALNQPEKLNSFLSWTDMGIVKVAEFGLVFLLAAHMFGGLRLLALEFLPWTSGQKTAAAGAVAASTLVAGVFLMRAI